MVTRRLNLTMMSLVLVAVIFVGCAKRPATTSASAPPPASPPAAAGPGPSGPAGPTGPGGPPPSTPGPAPRAATVRPAPGEFMSIAELKDVHFDFDKYDIGADDAKVLDANASWLKSNASHLVLIEGHCDERGTNEYNLALGERRAKSAMNYLVSQGVQASRITIISYGEERPLCTEHNEACWAKNRRDHFLVKPR